jgi:hypothetical protein
MEFNMGTALIVVGVILLLAAITFFVRLYLAAVMIAWFFAKLIGMLFMPFGQKF